jgi:hypothetical protein
VCSRQWRCKSSRLLTASVHFYLGRQFRQRRHLQAGGGLRQNVAHILYINRRICLFRKRRYATVDGQKTEKILPHHFTGWRSRMQRRRNCRLKQKWIDKVESPEDPNLQLQPNFWLQWQILLYLIIWYQNDVLNQSFLQSIYLILFPWSNEAYFTPLLFLFASPPSSYTPITSFTYLSSVSHTPNDPSSAESRNCSTLLPLPTFPWPFCTRSILKQPP